MINTKQDIMNLLHKFSLPILLTITIMGVAACSNAPAKTPAPSVAITNKAIQYVKNTLHQPPVRSWSVISTKTNTYGYFFPKATPPQSKMEVYEINISGNMEEPVCAANAKKGAACKEKVVPAIDHVFIAVSNNAIITETSQSQS